MRSTSPTRAPSPIVRLAAPLARAPGDRFVLRRDTGRIASSAASSWTWRRHAGISRRRQTPERVCRLAAAIEAARRGRRSRPPASTCTVRWSAGSGDRARRRRRRRDRRGRRSGPRGRRTATGDEPTRAARRPGPGRRTPAPAGDAASRAGRRGGDGVGRPAARRRPDRARRRTARACPGPIAGAAAGHGPGARPRRWTAWSAPSPCPRRRRSSEAARAAGCPAAGIRELERRAGSSSSIGTSRTPPRPTGSWRRRRSTWRAARRSRRRRSATRRGPAASTSWRSWPTSTGAGSCGGPRPDTSPARAPGRRRGRRGDPGDR